MEEWIPVISQVGFPIAVAAYLLIRMESTIKELTKAVTALTASNIVRGDPARKEVS